MLRESRGLAAGEGPPQHGASAGPGGGFRSSRPMGQPRREAALRCHLAAAAAHCAGPAGGHRGSPQIKIKKAHFVAIAPVPGGRWRGSEGFVLSCRVSGQEKRLQMCVPCG